MANENTLNEATVEHSCWECEQIFSNSSNLYVHMRQAHDSSAKGHVKSWLLCAMCKEESPSRKSYEEHLSSRHDVIVCKETLSFACENDYVTWKTEVEKDNNCMFVQNCGVKNIKSGKVTYLYCHRSGTFAPRGQSKKRQKILGTKKICSTCPSMIKCLVCPDLTIQVTYCKTHIGHSNDLARVKLTHQEKLAIVSKLSNKVPIKCILDEIRDSVSDKLERVHLLTRKDLANLKNMYNIGTDGMLDSNDAESVDMWVSLMHNREDSPVVFYKSQGSDDLGSGLCKKDFLLVLMNSTQKEMLSLYGNDVICLDFTHGMNSYNFDLATIVVLDSKREGFPAAFIFSSRQDQGALQVAFSAIKEQGIDIHPKVLMTDDAEAFCNAWTSIFGPPEKHLLCCWHVDRSWRKKLQELVSDKTEQANIYKMLRCLLTESDEQAFELMMEEVLVLLRENPNSTDFGTYFRKVYAKRTQSWAYCYRKWAGVNTNMHIERMHRTIKYIYLEGKKVKRLDKSIHCLMRFVKDKVFDNLIALERGKVTSKVSKLRSRHDAAEKLPVENVYENGEAWIVASNTRTGETYTVKKAESCLTNCLLLCQDCGYCLHNFTCTCVDNSIQWNMCKHIHLICKVINLDATSVINESAEVLGIETAEELIIDENDVMSAINCEKEIHMKHLLQKEGSASQRKLEIDIDANSKTLRELRNSCATLADYREYNKVLENAIAAFQTYKASQASGSVTFGGTVNKEPPNKKIKKQRMFISTKKVSRKKHTLSKPSPEEVQEITSTLTLSSKAVIATNSEKYIQVEK